MKEIIGDFWKEAEKGYDAIVCTTNGIVRPNGRLVMGAGIAKAFRDKFENLDLEWGNRLTAMYEDDPHFWPKLMVTENRWNILPKVKYLVAFPTKFDWKNPSSEELISASLDSLSVVISSFDWDSVLMTRPGCGCGGLIWDGKLPKGSKQVLTIRELINCYNRESMEITVINNE